MVRGVADDVGVEVVLLEGANSRNKTRRGRLMGPMTLDQTTRTDMLYTELPRYRHKFLAQDAMSPPSLLTTKI